MGVDVFFCFALLVQNFHQHNLVSLSDLTIYCYKTKVEYGIGEMCWQIVLNSNL